VDYKVIAAPSARLDLRDIVRYISQDAPERAILFGQFLINKTRILGKFPELGRKVPEFSDPASLIE